jgi:hypothetical protein
MDCQDITDVFSEFVGIENARLLDKSSFKNNPYVLVSLMNLRYLEKIS